jgi:hypothetical protein
MGDERTFSVTLVKVGPGLPYFEVGAWEYTAEWLPQVGDTIAITRISGPDAGEPEQAWGFVTRVNPTGQTPISVTELKSAPTSPDDYILAA